MAAKVRVPRRPIVFGGWKGRLDIDGSILRVVGDDPSNPLDVDCEQVKRYSFNSNSGLWAFRMQDGRKLYLQTSGRVMSADRSAAGRAATQSIAPVLAKHAGGGFSI